MAAINNNPLQHPTLLADIEQANTAITKMTDQSPAAKAYRVKEFCSENKPVVIRIAQDVAAKAAFGAALGTVFAGGAALVFAPPSATVVAKVGGLAGGFIGAYKGVKDQIFYIQRSRIYENWKSEALKNGVYMVFEKYVSRNLTVDHQCPYTLDFIMCPVRDSHGHVFEQSYMLRDLERGGGRAVCQKAHNHDIVAADLSYDLQYHNTLMQALKPAFDTAVQDPNVVAGVLSLRQNIEEERAQMLREATEQKFKQYMDCKSPEEEDEIGKQVLADLKENKKKFKLQLLG